MGSLGAAAAAARACAALAVSSLRWGREDGGSFKVAAAILTVVGCSSRCGAGRVSGVAAARDATGEGRWLGTLALPALPPPTMELLLALALVMPLLVLAAAVATAVGRSPRAGGEGTRWPLSRGLTMMVLCSRGVLSSDVPAAGGGREVGTVGEAVRLLCRGTDGGLPVGRRPLLLLRMGGAPKVLLLLLSLLLLWCALPERIGEGGTAPILSLTAFGATVGARRGERGASPRRALGGRSDGGTGAPLLSKADCCCCCCLGCGAGSGRGGTLFVLKTSLSNEVFVMLMLL